MNMAMTAIPSKQHWGDGPRERRSCGNLYKLFHWVAATGAKQSSCGRIKIKARETESSPISPRSERLPAIRQHRQRTRSVLTDGSTCGQIWKQSGLKASG